MKKITLLSFIAAALCVMFSCAGSQEKTDEKILTEKSMKVWGNCEQCKATIEKAGKIKGVSSINWNEDSKVLTLKMDTTEVAADAVLRSIANAGYDNELYKADDKAYAELPECCQYERKP